MIQRPDLIGSQAKFAIAGTAFTAPTAGSVSASVIPDNAATIAGGGAVWFDLGIIESASEKTDSTKIPIFRPSPGALQLSENLRSKFQRTINLKVSECSNAMFFLMKRALGPLSPLSGAMGQFVPLSMPQTNGWLKLQQYSGRDNTLLFAEQVWGEISIENAVEAGGDKQLMFDLTISMLWSPLNSANGS